MRIHLLSEYRRNHIRKGSRLIVDAQNYQKPLHANSGNFHFKYKNLFYTRSVSCCDLGLPQCEAENKH